MCEPGEVIMEFEGSWIGGILPFVPSAATTAVIVAVLFVTRFLLEKRGQTR